MFVNAIQEVQKFTRSLHTIVRYYGNDFATPWAATLFFVNDEGVAITCKHVAENLIHSEAINNRYTIIKEEMDAIGVRNRKNKKQMYSIEAKYSLKKQETPIQIKNTFFSCVDTFTRLECISHPSLDLAIIKFHGFGNLLYTSHAKFLRDTSRIKQGKYLCRYGFPFAEFTNFHFDTTIDDINFTNSGKVGTPPFPIDGIITRNLVGPEGRIVGIEMSTAGLKGQSGGPLFDTNGVVYGMQYGTNHLHLGFDIKNKDLILNGKKTRVNNQPFLHVGHCVHVDRIKEFLTEHNVTFHEAD